MSPRYIYAIDPGITKTGWAILEIVDDGKIRVHKVGTLDGDQLVKERKEMRKLFRSSFAKLDIFFETFVEIIRSVYLLDPHMKIVTEGCFYHHMIQVFLSLSLVIHTLRRAAHLCINRDICTVAPKQTKLAVSGDGTADKEKMFTAVTNHPNIDLSPLQSRNEVLNEHEIDAIAHGYAAYVSNFQLIKKK